MNDTQSRVGRRAEGHRRVGKATAWIAAACTVAAAAFGVVFATGTSDAQSSASTSAASSDSGDTVQAPDSAPQQSSGQAHTGSGGS